MKHVILLLPDKIISKIGGSLGYSCFDIPLTRKNLIKVLTERLEYHEDYYFPEDEIKILSLTKVKQPGKHPNKLSKNSTKKSR